MTVHCTLLLQTPDGAAHGASEKKKRGRHHEDRDVELQGRRGAVVLEEVLHPAVPGLVPLCILIEAVVFLGIFKESVVF